MVAVPTGAPSPRTVALVLAVLGYRRPLHRRDRWSRPALLAHQDHALRRLREYAYQRSRFYQDFHAGLASAPLSALPVLTKQTLMESFDSVVTHPICDWAMSRITWRHSAAMSCSKAGTSSPQRPAPRADVASSCGPSGSGFRLSPPTIARSTGPAPPPA
jgi:hypothetical protein